MLVDIVDAVVCFLFFWKERLELEGLSERLKIKRQLSSSIANHKENVIVAPSKVVDNR